MPGMATAGRNCLANIMIKSKPRLTGSYNRQTFVAEAKHLLGSNEKSTTAMTTRLYKEKSTGSLERKRK
jgi:hypothetical protein